MWDEVCSSRTPGFSGPRGDLPKFRPDGRQLRYTAMTMDWRAALAVTVVVGFASGVVCAKEFGSGRFAAPLAAVPNAIAPRTVPVGAASFPDVAFAARGAARDPASDLLASNPYEAELAPYRTALNVEGDHPLLEDPYEDARRFANPYENTVGVANPYVDALRESEMRKQARLENPYTTQLRDEAALLQNPYARRR